MNTESKTPRTDALARSYTDGSLFALARTLERENARLREALELIAMQDTNVQTAVGKVARAALLT